MLISVIVPVYNVEKYIEKCVDSIINQTYKDLEIILVDDGSTDKSGMICDDYAKIDNRIKVIHQKNKGLSAARNTGIKNSYGEYIGFVDSDDYIGPTMYEKMVKQASLYSYDLCVVGCKNVYEGTVIRDNRDRDAKEYVFSCEEAYKSAMIGRIIPITVCPKIFKRELIEKVKFVDGKYYEDGFFLTEIMPLVNSAWATTEQLYFYVHRENSITTEQFNKKHLDIIEAYRINYDLVSKSFPEIKYEAEFRCDWSYFNVLDRLLLSFNYKDVPEYYEVKKYLRRHTIRIVRCGYFSIFRRISAVLLTLNVNLYKLALKIKNSKDRIKD